jgi:AraC family transcriptional regulator of adaptative response/methylated-DNA-[protein]-cysteine methyltransferase
VAFHQTAAQAASAGFRPCLRCRPTEPALAQRHAELVAQACRLIDRSDPAPGLDELARDAGLSPHHFHRLFKSVAGITPRAYAQARRAERVRQHLPSADSVTTALFDAGYQSNGRFYSDSAGMLGMKPGQYRAGGAQVTIRFAIGECVLGSILVAATDKGLCAISLGDDPEALLHELEDRFPRARLIGGDGPFEALVAQVVALVQAPVGASAPAAALPMDIRGTAFQQRVWQALCAIPRGTTVTYSDVAQRLGMPKAVRAVASACAANTLALAVPCHRVVRRDGSLSGYRWGVERKRALLDIEATG